MAKFFLDFLRIKMFQVVYTNRHIFLINQNTISYSDSSSCLFQFMKHRFRKCWIDF